MTDDIDPRPEVAEREREPDSSTYWLAEIEDAEKAFATYHAKCDNIDKLFADLEKLASIGRDREFQLFWANIQVLGPSVYARPPVPVVVPRFKDRRPLPRVASELLERASISAFAATNINEVMLLTRDDLIVSARGAPRVRYESRADSTSTSERVLIEHMDRRDFLHQPARKWPEVGWVGYGAWLNREAMKKRFSGTSGDAYKEAEYAVRREDRQRGAADREEQARVWEIWSRDERKVFWVAKGCPKILDQGDPHHKLEGFYPSPKPAYATVQRGSLIPVPDALFYKDQLEEINELTARISALVDGVRVQGFYPQGAGEIGDAIEAAMRSTDKRRVMIPISNWAAFGGGAAKDSIVWLPIDMIVDAIKNLVEMRRQLIDDVYQITGLSDIMRGETQASETLGAQQIKTQFGQVRIRDKQSELVRVARDAGAIAAEIMAEQFSQKTLLDMSQMDIPTDAEIGRQVREIEQQARQTVEQQVTQAVQQQAEQAMGDEQQAQALQADPAQAQAMLDQLVQQAQTEIEPQVMGQAQAEIEKLRQTPTIEQVMALLRDQHLRPFALDIETDSTIQPDEDAEKQRRAEFMTVLGQMLQQAAALLQMFPQAAGFIGESIKFALAPYRAGRELEGTIDEMVEQMVQAASQPQEQGPSDAEVRAQIEMQKLEAASEKWQAEMQFKQADFAIRQQESQAKVAEIMARLEADQHKLGGETEKMQADIAHVGAQIEKIMAEIGKIGAETEKTAVETGISEQSAAVSAAQAVHGMAAQDRSADLAERQAMNGGQNG